MRKAIAGLGILVLSALMLSCGYYFSPGGENINPNVKKIYVDTLFNNTSEANAENIFRNALNDRFRTTSRFKLAENKEQADAVVSGGIKNLYSSHQSYSSTDVTKEDRVTAVLDMSFEIKGQGVIWSNHNFSWYEDYIVDPNNPASTDSNRRAAIQKLATDISDRIYRAIMSGF